jgi:FKBP-type peptidyl-prolyl cis-trans isomerase
MYGMKAGGTRLLIIPPAVGYGSQGKGLVPPDAVLVFEVRLTNVK